MRLLFDQNISFRVTRPLQDVFPGCKHVSDCELTDAEDTEIWDYARRNGFVIVTFDSDFYDISIIYSHPPKIIWLRSGNLTTTGIVDLLKLHKQKIDIFISGKDYADISCLEIDLG